MATRTQSDRPESRLRELGLDPSAPPDQTLEALRSLLGKTGADKAAIARAIGDLKTTAAADLLGEMEMNASGASRREIRRALFKLRQHGIAHSRPEPPADQAKSAATGESETLFALLSGYDPADTRIVWIMKPRFQGGLNQLTAVISWNEGLVGAGVTMRSRREMREQRTEIEREFKTKFVEADWRLADFIVCEAWRQAAPDRRREVGDFFAMRAEMIAADPPPADFIHPIYAELLSEPAEPAADLLKLNEILGWRFPAGAIKPFVDEISELKSSTLVLNPLAQQERIDAVMDRALMALLGSERVRRRFEDIAYYLARTGQTQAARWAAAAAAAIRDGADLKRIPFFRNFIRVVLGTTLAQEEERAKEQPRLIVTPAEAMRERQSRTR